MRSIWKGSITFGLVNVPVKLYSATEDHDVSLHQVHEADGGRIRYQRKCEVCGKIVKYEDIDKAYDDGERTVVLTDEDLDSLPAERSREIEVVEFVPSEQIDPIMLDRSYFLEPDSSSPKAYVLLRETLEKTDRTAIVQFALRQKTRLATLRVRDDVIVLQTLLWGDEVREANFPSLDASVRISPQELKMSTQLVTSFEADFEPEKFTDEYQEQLRTLIEAKLREGESLNTEETFGRVPEGEEGGGEVLDLMEALRRSVEKGRSGSSGSASGSSGSSRSSSRSPSRSGAASSAATKTKKTASRGASAKAAPGRTSASSKDDAEKAPAKTTRRKSAG